MSRIASAVLLLLVLASGSFTGEVVAPLNDSVYLSAPVVVDNVTVWPVYSKTQQAAVADYVTLDQAQKKNMAVVRETGGAAQQIIEVPAQAQTDRDIQRQQTRQSAPAAPAASAQSSEEPRHQRAAQQVDGGGAQVGQLVIENKGAQAILVLAGTIVKGGQQDRQIAQDFIIPPGQTVPVGAFCIEHGRWTASREGANTNGQFQAQEVLANKEIRDKAQFKSSQQEVWEYVSIVNDKNAKIPATGTLLASIEETDKEALARRERIKKALSEKFTALAQAPDAPVGLAYAVDGKIREIRTFAHSRIMGLYRETLINTIAMEGDLAQRKALAQKKEIFKQPAAHQQAVDLVAGAEKLKEEQQKFSGNDNGYRKDGKVWNANLYAKDPAAERAAPAAPALPVSQAFVPAE